MTLLAYENAIVARNKQLKTVMISAASVQCAMSYQMLVAIDYVMHTCTSLRPHLPFALTLACAFSASATISCLFVYSATSLGVMPAAIYEIT
jgi:hypothetical protein